MKMLQGIIHREEEGFRTGASKTFKQVAGKGVLTGGGQGPAALRLKDPDASPGFYIDIFQNSDFRASPRDVEFQFFGSMTDKAKGDDPLQSRNPWLGPGTYELTEGSFSARTPHKLRTTTFTTTHKEFPLNPGNQPGPQHYQVHPPSFTQRQIEPSVIGSFGSTEKKFASLSCQQEASPGPGAYKSTSFVPRKFVARGKPGEKKLYQALKQSCVFSSKSARNFDPTLENTLRQNLPGVGQYEVKEFGSPEKQGGAVSNFLLCRAST